jgi:hypothetical protein
LTFVLKAELAFDAMARHPMYTAAMLGYLATPFALGSRWALLLAVLSARRSSRGSSTKSDIFANGYRVMTSIAGRFATVCFRASGSSMRATRRPASSP